MAVSLSEWKVDILEMLDLVKQHILLSTRKKTIVDIKLNISCATKLLLSLRDILYRINFIIQIANIFTFRFFVVVWSITILSSSIFTNDVNKPA